jgi:hypothetical protein
MRATEYMMENLGSHGDGFEERYRLARGTICSATILQMFRKNLLVGSGSVFFKIVGNFRLHDVTPLRKKLFLKKHQQLHRSVSLNV